MGLFSNKTKKVKAPEVIAADQLVKEALNQKPQVIDRHKVSDQFAKEVVNSLEPNKNEEKEDLVKLVGLVVPVLLLVIGIFYSIIWIGMMLGTILTLAAIGYFLAVVLPSYQQGVPINHQEKINQLIESFSQSYRNALKKEEAEKKTVKGRMKRALKTVGEIVMDSD